MAQITIPRFFPQPWAANELMPPLTPEEMATGYPSGTSEKPTRQSINNALQYAINGVLYYLTTGVPAWVSDAVYSVGSIVLFSGNYFYSTVDANVGQQPDALAGWERLPWRRSDLDGLYMTQAQANARFLSPETGDLRYYTQAAANALFLTQANAAAQFVTQAALEASFLTTEQANALFLTQAQADQRYAFRTDVVNRVTLAATLADFETRANAEATFMTQEQADAHFMTAADASAVFETQVDARATFLALEDAGLRIFRGNVSFNRGALVLDRDSSIIYVSQADENINNSLLEPAWWRPWLTAVPADPSGLFLNFREFAMVGSFTLEATDVPMLADHPDGIYMRVIAKGSGGNGAAGDIGGHGGGEGVTVDAFLQNVTASMFPVRVTIMLGANTSVIFGTAPALTFNAGSGGNASTAAPGAAAATAGVQNPGSTVVSWRRIDGSRGRFGVANIRGGDGGGALGGTGVVSGFTQGNANGWANGRRGCGSGGVMSGLTAVTGAPGFVQFFW